MPYPIPAIRGVTGVTLKGLNKYYHKSIERGRPVDRIQVVDNIIYTKEGGQSNNYVVKLDFDGNVLNSVTLATGKDGNQLVGLYVGDTDSDGDVEVIVTVDDWFWINSTSKIVMLRASDLSTKHSTHIDDRTTFFSVGDVDKDNKLEFFVQVDYTSYTLKWYEDDLTYIRDTGNSNGRPWGNYLPAVIYDIDEDGNNEVIYGTYGDHYLRIYGPDGTEKYNLDVGHDAAFPAIGDLDGDGKPEIIVKGGGKISAVKFSGGSLTKLYEVDGGSWALIMDYDGDGNNELITAYNPSGTEDAVVKVYKGSDGSLKQSITLSNAGSVCSLIHYDTYTYHYLNDFVNHYPSSRYIILTTSSNLIIFHPRDLSSYSIVPLSHTASSCATVVGEINGEKYIFVGENDRIEIFKLLLVTETSETLKQSVSPDLNFMYYVEGIHVIANNPSGSGVTLYFKVKAELDNGSEVELASKSVSEGDSFDSWLRWIYDSVTNQKIIKSIKLYAYCSDTPASGSEPTVQLERVTGLQG